MKCHALQNIAYVCSAVLNEGVLDHLRVPVKASGQHVQGVLDHLSLIVMRTCVRRWLRRTL